MIFFLLRRRDRHAMADGADRRRRAGARSRGRKPHPWRQAGRALHALRQADPGDQGPFADLPAGDGGAVLRLARPPLHQGRDGQALALRQQVGNCPSSSTCRKAPRWRTRTRWPRPSPEPSRKCPRSSRCRPMPGSASPFNFNGLVRHYYLRAYPYQGDVQINLTPEDRTRPRKPRDRAGKSASGSTGSTCRRAPA